MKSGKQRREEIKTKRLERVAQLAAIGKRTASVSLQFGAIAADHAQLAHNNTYGLLPDFYTDKAFACRDCNSLEVWTAKQQKWWYEIAKGAINSQAVRCRPCRVIERERSEEARRVSTEGLARKRATKELKEKND